MANEDIKMLLQAIKDFAQWTKTVDEHGRYPQTIYHTQALNDFLSFAIIKDITWKDMFTLDTLKDFQKYSSFKNAPPALMALSGYLFSYGKIDQHIINPRPQVELPDIYEQYLMYYEQSINVSQNHLRQTRRILASFHEYLKRHQIELPALKIEHLDAFIAGFKVAAITRRMYSYLLRGFLRYLYYECRVIKRDLAKLLVRPPLFAQAKPPKYLRLKEVKKLFAGLKLSTPTESRTYAMVYLAYTLGLRPAEISRISLDDISFSKGELTLPKRKGGNPITLPLPEQTIKAIAFYLTKGRPKSPHRHIFLTSVLPYRPVSAGTVIYHISKAMKQTGLYSSSYWLRHTYAQNLLNIGRSIYEIKEMMGHQNIQSTNRYLYIHTELMRKVLFDEEL